MKLIEQVGCVVDIENHLLATVALLSRIETEYDWGRKALRDAVVAFVNRRCGTPGDAEHATSDRHVECLQRALLNAGLED